MLLLMAGHKKRPGENAGRTHYTQRRWDGKGEGCG